MITNLWYREFNEVLSEVISNDEIVATASKEFTVLSSEYTLTGVTGTLNLSSHEISPADTLTITSDIKNGSNEALENIVSYVTITSITDKKEIKRYEFHSTLGIGEDDNNISEFIGESLGEDDYIVTYEAVLGDGTVKTLATDYFTIKYIRDDFEEDSDLWNYMGDAYRSSEGYAVLTHNVNHQIGAMWLKKGIDKPFVTSFRYMEGGGNSADGFVFMFNKKGDEIGADGAYMGFAEGSGYGLEFDSFGNTNQGEHSAGGAKHIALSKDYIVTPNVGSTVPSLAITTDENVTSKINDGQWHDVVVKVRKDGVRVYLDTELILKYNGTLDDTYTSVGFAAATGGYSQYHYIDDIAINEDIEKITYTVEDDFSIDSGLWNYMGSAGYNQNQYGLLNQTAEWQAGAMWLKQEIGTEFETSFDYRIHRGNGYADGFTYMFFKKGNELGNNGQSMGFAENSGYAIEFDTYYNSEQDEKNNTYSMHIALVKNSTSGNSSQVLACTNDENIISKLCDESEHTVKVRVTLSTVTVYIDDEKALEYIGELDTTYRNTGFSAGTGGYNESHVIDNFTCTFDMYE